MCALPTKTQLLNKMNENESSAKTETEYYVAASTPVIMCINKLFLSKDLGIDWGFDDEMRAVVARNVEGRGMNLHPRTSLSQIQLVKTEDGIKVTTDHGVDILADYDILNLFATQHAY